MQPTHSQADADLLRAVARPALDAPLIHGILPRIADGHSLCELARQHGLLPLLYARFVEANAALSAEAMARLHAEYSTNVAQNLAAASELLTLLALFERHEIRALPFKGVTLAHSLHGKVGLRPAGDLDILIHREDLSKAASLAMGQGYQLQTAVQPGGNPSAPNVFEYHFERPSDGMILELRWRLNQWYFRAGLGMDWLWPRREPLALLGATVPGMSPEDTLIVLCVHGSKHGWSRLIWLRDVAQLLASHPDLHWERALRDAHRFGLSRNLELGVFLAAEMLEATLPESARADMQKRPALRKLARHIAQNFFDDATRLPGGGVPYHVQLLESGDRLRWWWRAHPWKPNEEDRRAIRLPKGLGFLYYLVRPLRLLRKARRPPL